MRFLENSVALTSIAVLSMTLLANASQAQPTYVNKVAIAGNSTDLSGAGTPNQNRLSPGSDLFYDAKTGFYYGLPDRGPGGGLISYETRVQKFSLDVNPTTGAIGNFQLVETVKLTGQNGQALNGLNPGLLNGNSATLGNSFDPEAFALAPNGNFLISDEYGPSLYEFTPTGSFVRAFTPPANLLPRQADTTLNFVDGRPTITTGRQDNRGYEGLAVSTDGTKAYAILQDPLVNEGLNGPNNDGRVSRNLRIVEYSLATGASTAQYIYQLEPLSSINARVPGNTFGATAQGRNIGVSAIIPLNSTQFLVLERDNRGLGVDELADANPGTFAPVASKRLYKIDLTGATNVSGVSLTGTNNLPGGVNAVQKELYLDIAAALVGANEDLGAGQRVPEKIEGVTIGPRLADGSNLLLLSSDNDFSVTQTGAGEQFDVYLNGAQRPIGAANDTGSTLLPSFLFAFKATVAPEPASGALLLLVAGGFFVRRRCK